MTKKTSKVENSLKVFVFVMCIMFLGKTSGLLRDIFEAAYLGTVSQEAKSFSIASLIPLTFLDITFASAISSSFIPIFNSYLEKKNKEEAFKLANNFITVILILSFCLTALMMVFSGDLVSLVSQGIDNETKSMTVNLLIIMLPTIVLSAFAFSLIGILQSLGEFNIPAGMSILSNLIIIFYFVFLYNKYGVYGLAVSFLIGWVSQIVIQLPSLHKKGFRFKPNINLSDKGLRQIGKLSIPVLISSWIFPINSLVNFSVVATIIGAQPAIKKANSLYSVITGVFILSIANIIFPKLAKNIANDDKVSFAKTMNSTLRVLIFIVIPMTVGLFVLSEPVVNLIFFRKEFDLNSVSITANGLKYYSIGMLGFGMYTIVSRGFYADKSGYIPLITSLIAIVINFLLSTTLVNYLSIGGPALANSISLSVASLIMLYFMSKNYTGVVNKQMLITFVQVLTTALLMGLIVYLSYNYVDNLFVDNSFVFKTLKLALSILSGIAFYFVICVLLKIEEALFVLNLVRKKMRLY